MAVTAAFSLYTTSPPARSPFSGCVVLSNGGADCTLTNFDIVPPKNTVIPPDLNIPLAANTPGAIVFGGGASGGERAGGGSGSTFVSDVDVKIPSGGTLSIPFYGIAVGGTWTATAETSDGSNPVATVTLTPV